MMEGPRFDPTELPEMETEVSLAVSGEAAKKAPKPQTYFDCELGYSPVDSHHDPQLQYHCRFVYASGAVYDGQWHNGMRHGFGRQVWKDGTEYVGNWIEGRAGGLGHIMHCGGDSFTGQWINGRAHGKGVFRFKGGAATYRGEFHCDLREGLGVESWVDGSLYIGQFKKGEKSGFGENRWPDGSCYLGCWSANSPLGPGELCKGNCT